VIRRFSFLRHVLICAAAVEAALSFSGCGGGQGAGSGGDQTLTFGPIVTRVAGLAQPPVTGGTYGAVVTGLAGGSVTNLEVFPVNDLSNTKIAFWERDRIFTMDPDGLNKRQINDQVSGSYMSWSPDGTKIAFVGTDGNGFYSQIWTMYADGSNPINVSNSFYFDRDPSWSPDGTKIAFDRTTLESPRQIWVMNADGTNQKHLIVTIQEDLWPTWSPTGTLIAYSSTRDKKQFDLYVADADGSNPHNISNDQYSHTEPSWSPDGRWIAHTFTYNGNRRIAICHADGSEMRWIGTDNPEHYSPSWAPDSSKIACTVSTGNNSDPQIHVMHSAGTDSTDISIPGDPDGGAAWSPFLGHRVIVGKNGILGLEANGFLFGQRDKNFASLLTFGALRPENARITSLSENTPGLPNLVFSITADAIKGINYLNGLMNPIVAVNTTIDRNTFANGAIVSFSGTDATIASVVPYLGSRSADSEPIKSTMAAGTRVLRGRFLGVYDAKGRNAAPSGAREIRIDSSTGTLLGFQ